MNKHKFGVVALLLGVALIGAGLANQFILVDPVYHPLSGYALIAAGAALVLRAVHPPIGIMRVVTTIAGGACLGALPMFVGPDLSQPPKTGLALVMAGMVLLAIGFSRQVKIHRH